MKNYILSFCLFFSTMPFIFAFHGEPSTTPPAGGYEIKVKLDNYKSDTLLLGFHYGDKQYVKDTTVIAADGTFTFKADTLLPCGMYLLVMKPANNYIQLLLPDYDQTMSVQADAENVVSSIKIKGSEDNITFYEYMDYLAKIRPEADTMRAEFERKKGSAADSTRITHALNDLDKRVKKHQAEIAEKNVGKLVGSVIKAAIEVEIPEFKGTDQERAVARYHYAKEHYFDNVDLTNVCLLRSPINFQRVDNYISKMTPQHPDSLNISLDYILQKVKSSPDVYKYYLIHFLNTYAKSNIVGMDACYVHIAKKYYCTGQTPWSSKEDIEKICDNANRLEPILIGKIAPDILMKDRQGKPARLYDMDADYTVLFFWDPECGHCKKSAPDMVKFGKAFKDKSVKTFAVCTAVTDKEPECWKSVDEKEFTDFFNVSDPYIQSKYKTLYDIRSTPQIFILNREHKILMKRIGAEQLIDVMNEVIKVEAEKAKKGKL